MDKTQWIVVTNHSVNVVGLFPTLAEALAYAKRELIGYCWDIRQLSKPDTLRVAPRVKHPAWC